jgi:hypothetical protein
VVVEKVRGLSQADVSRAAEDAVKHALLQEQSHVTTSSLLSALDERTSSSRSLELSETTHA